MFATTPPPPPPSFLGLPNELHFEVSAKLTLSTKIRLILALAVRPQSALVTIYLDKMSARNIEELLEKAIQEKVARTELAVLLGCLRDNSGYGHCLGPFMACIARADVSRLRMLLDHTAPEVLVKLAEGRKHAASLLWHCVVLMGSGADAGSTSAPRCLELVLSRCEGALTSVVPCPLANIPFKSRNGTMAMATFRRLLRVPVLRRKLALTGQPLSIWAECPDDSALVQVISDIDLTSKAKAAVCWAQDRDAGLWNEYLTVLRENEYECDWHLIRGHLPLPPAGAVLALFPPEYTGANVRHPKFDMPPLLLALYWGRRLRFGSIPAPVRARENYRTVITQLLAGGADATETHSCVLPGSVFERNTTAAAMAVWTGFRDVFPNNCMHPEWSVADLVDNLAPMPPFLETAVNRDRDALLELCSEKDKRILLDGLEKVAELELDAYTSEEERLADALRWVLAEVLDHEDYAQGTCEGQKAEEEPLGGWGDEGEDGCGDEGQEKGGEKEMDTEDWENSI
ncbi:hypothetical protein FN846DRAFT_1021348 [Sphaerosporella brunnea]|uniref:Uncharacterized protein n=1 Tax=Sphaerosporella brunnea TaxID=1250544 RepID=A0A5J5EY49_9PEZI|nr:hypothetical protein FN846DRAFT_1021348 [Sphaerosporella brunnea]